MKYLEIKNKGLIEPEALTLLGGTTKRNDSTKIGMFGSGNKYALAYFIRNKIGINVFSGDKEIKISTIQRTFRDKDLNIITVNRKETSITDDTGPKWDLWQCIREIYSNAVDEGILSFQIVNEINIDNKSTSFFIEGNKDVLDFFTNKEKYIYNENRVLFECSHGRILKKFGKTANIYRKGIRCFDTQKTSLYDYDIFDIDINESRIVNRDSEAMQAIWSILSLCTDKSIVENFLENHSTDSIIENNYYIDYWSFNNYEFKQSMVWDEIFKEKLVAPYKLGGFVDSIWHRQTYFVCDALYQKLKSIYGNDISALKGVNGQTIKYLVKEPTAIELATINKAKEFFAECDFEISFSVYVVDFIVEDKNSIMGLAHNENILISSYCIERGVQYVVDTIFEEYVHLKHNCSDETRGMQNALISEMINYMKIKNCIVL